MKIDTQEKANIIPASLLYLIAMKTIIIALMTLLASTHAAQNTCSAFVPKKLETDACLAVRGGAMGFDESLALKATTVAASAYGKVMNTYI